MIPKTDYFAWIDRYLNDELNDVDLLAFKAELNINRSFADELKLHQEVESFIKEEDVLELRNSLSELTNHLKTKLNKQEINLSFELSDELKDVHEVEREIFDEIELPKLDNQLHRVHISQHRKVRNEELYDLLPNSISEIVESDASDLLEENDEKLFEDVGQAIQETDIMKLRVELGELAASTSFYPFSSEDVELYVNGEMSRKQVGPFEKELAVNRSLARAVKLSKEVDEAVSESDIMNLRALLKNIHSESVVPQQEKESDAEEKYICHEEVTAKRGGSSKIPFLKEVEGAIAEEDIMNLRNELNSIHHEEIKKNRNILRFVGNTRKSWELAAACAVFAVVIGGTWEYLDGRKPANVYAQFYSPYQSFGIDRSGGKVQGVLSLALQKYNEQRYQEALSLFQLVIKQNGNDPAGNFYAGMSYQELRQYQKAIYHYDRVIRNHDNLFVEQAEWYMGLCFLQTNNRNKAIPLFQKIQNEHGYYGSKAEKILKEIR